MKRLPVFLVVLLLVVVSGCGGGAIPTEEPARPKSWDKPPPMTIDLSKSYVATLRTNMGNIKIALFANETPVTVNNFVFLAREGFYDGVKFHRVIKGFMIQTGDPGTGGPGYKFDDEPFARDYEAGTVAMANAGPNTNGSQFFIAHTDLRGRLAKDYTIFGKVIQGLDVVDKIASVPVEEASRGEVSRPTVDVHIIGITIEEK